jgi:hypothetical protein
VLRSLAQGTGGRFEAHRGRERRERAFQAYAARLGSQCRCATCPATPRARAHVRGAGRAAGAAGIALDGP